jgi:hypothetical protein
MFMIITIELSRRGSRRRSIWSRRWWRSPWIEVLRHRLKEKEVRNKKRWRINT